MFSAGCARLCVRLCVRVSPCACRKVTAVGFEPTPLRTGALSQRLRPLGQTVLPAVHVCVCVWVFVRFFGFAVCLGLAIRSMLHRN